MKTEDRPVAFGLPGTSIRPGDHLCAFYRGQHERDELLVPYLSEGIRSGHKCVCLVDSLEPTEVLAMLGEHGNGHARPGQLEVMGSLETYLRTGEFDPDGMVTFWDETLHVALDVEGYPFLRGIGEMTWALRDLPGVEHLALYESKLNDLFPRYSLVGVCLYDLTAFTGAVIIDMLKTHPKVLLGGSIFENPYYVTPEEFLASRS